MAEEHVRLLAVDDSLTMRWIYRQVTQDLKLGIEFIEAKDGVEGLTMVRSCRPHIVILDYRMPGLDGEELRSKMRNILRFDGPIIFITSEDPASVRDARRDPGVTYLRKPCEATDSPQAFRYLLGFHLRTTVMRMSLQGHI